MPDGFDANPDAPLPTEGEFRTAYSTREWRKHLGKHCAFHACLIPAVTAIVGFKEGWNQGLLIWFALTILIGLTIWILALVYRAKRCRNEVITIDWHHRVVRFEGMRSTTKNLFTRDPLGVTLGFDDILRASKARGYRWTPSRVYVTAKETEIVAGLHFDDTGGLLTRLNRVGSLNPTPTFHEALRRARNCPLVLFFILLLACFIIAGVVFKLTS